MRLAGFAVVVFAVCAYGETVQFNRDIRPILSDRCFHCHGPDASTRKSKLRLDVESGAKIELGKGKQAFVAGRPEESEVFRRITTSNKALRMPPAYAGHNALTEREIALVRQWIEQGAKWQAHWSFIAPQRPEFPDVKQPDWVRNAIDRFVLARLEREGLKPSVEASGAALLRRVTFDLTGLPPTQKDLDAFLGDTSGRAYERAVDRLLASSRYAERMAIRWLEAARYADTNGYQSDGVRDMYRWRDWVIDAFHRNMPFDQFTVEQIAGDLLPSPTLSQRIATGFHRNHRTSAEGGIVDEEFRGEYVADRVETTSTVWLGLTLGCTRCHDHKYDPFKQKEFYQLFAFFNNMPEKGFVYNFGNEEPFIKAPTEEQRSRLKQLDSRVHSARQDWARLAGLGTAGPAEELTDAVSAGRVPDVRKPSWRLADWAADSPIGKAEAKWQEKVRSKKQVEWTPSAGLVLDRKLDPKAKFDSATPEVSFGTEVAKFNHRDALTLAARFKAAAPKGAILSRVENYFEGTGYAIYLIDSKIRFHFVFRWTDLGMRVETEEPVSLNEWHHVAVTYDGNMKAAGTRIYVDGKPRKLKVLFDQHLWPVENKVPFRVGAGGGKEYNFQGEIDDVKVWSRELGQHEIAAIALEDRLNDIARLPEQQRSPAQQAKIRLAFLDAYLPPAAKAAKAKIEEAEAARAKYWNTIPTVMVMVEGPHRPAYLLKRGAYDAHGDEVQAAVPAALPPIPNGFKANRLGLARWLVSRDHPLTARVTVNRLWQMLFGTGLVKTVEDFGSQGEWPVHAELLDWLAVEFMESGWDVKAILKTIVMSSTYRQSSKVGPELLQRDPENRLIARGPRTRLSAEMVRDQALAVSGLLVDKVGGPSVKPYQPAGLWRELAGGSEYKSDSGEGLYRRSLYTYWRRTIAPPSMINFDSPTRETCIVRESRTNTPLQSLTLMNDVIYIESARKLAERMMREGGTTDEGRLTWGFREVLTRSPNARELRVLEKARQDFATRYANEKEAALQFASAGESPMVTDLDYRQLAAYTAVASMLLNLDEAVTKQ